MMPRRYETLDILRLKESMAAKVARKDQAYPLYAGAELTDALQLARIDSLIESHIIPARMMPWIKLYRSFIDRRRKAYFAAICSEISILGFLLGLERQPKDASDTRAFLNQLTEAPVQ